jgi:hypothetical protein
MPYQLAEKDTGRTPITPKEKHGEWEPLPR